MKTNLYALSIRQSRFSPIPFLMLSMNREEMKNWFYKAIRQEMRSSLSIIQCKVSSTKQCTENFVT